jgi:hypothetical protein
MDLFDILSRDGRVIVFSSREHHQIYTWNKSRTLQLWGLYDRGEGDYELDDWNELDARVLPDSLQDYTEARLAAQEWHSQIESEVRCSCCGSIA